MIVSIIWRNSRFQCNLRTRNTSMFSYAFECSRLMENFLARSGIINNFQNQYLTARITTRIITFRGWTAYLLTRKILAITRLINRHRHPSRYHDCTAHSKLLTMSFYYYSHNSVTRKSLLRCINIVSNLSNYSLAESVILSTCKLHV